ncbi:MAG: WG repeat-containing protein [Candidatus Eremiobacteraeota bacterium]|nr:WG repeat-containing protein [Candidatus Eremiobacteraeota bacterium]
MQKLFLFLLLLTQVALAQNYQFEATAEGWSIRQGEQECKLAQFLKDERVSVTTGAPDNLLLLRFDGRLGLLRDGKLAVPPLYRSLGMTTYVGEVGWVHSTQILDGFTGCQNDGGLWGLLDKNGRVVIEPAFGEILYDGYFFSGNINPLEGMQDCRELAERNGHEILGFALQDRKALGYFTSSGAFISL